MTKTVCDLCSEDEALRPETGHYVITVIKVPEAKFGPTENTYDVCGACMQTIRKARPEMTITNNPSEMLLVREAEVEALRRRVKELEEKLTGKEIEPNEHN